MPASGTDTVSGCNLVVYDNGYQGVYSGTSTIVVRPAQPGQLVGISGGWFHNYCYQGSCQGTLTIYDGEGTNGTVLLTMDSRDTINDTILGEEGAITIKMSWLRNAVAVAAAVIAFLMIGTPVSNSDMTSDVKQSAFIHVGTSADATRHHRPAAQKADEPSPVASEEADLKAVEELVTPDKISPASAPSFGIVMASQVTERNAKAFIDQLTASGYAQARIVVSGPKQIRRVIYGSYASEAEAVDSMQQLRRQSRLFKDTWILEIKP
jgi:hypothetical protein